MSILVVDDEPDLLELYELTLVREGLAVETASSVASAWQRLSATSYDLLITDMRLPDGSGLDLIRRLEAAQRRERVLVITAFGSADNAVEALKAGAFDYLAKPVDLRRFRQVVASALGASTARRARNQPSAQPVLARPDHESGVASASLDRLVGRSRAMQQVREVVARVARTMAPVLVRGESGTGKELIARAVHEASNRADGPFVPVNCGAIAESLIEAELFGYRRGAFTGAEQDQAGLFQAAEGGTLFLDEIGDLPLAMQAKLLRAVQERAVRAVGATQEVATDVRIVAATHHDLADMVSRNRFRQDLFYRLSVIEVWMPPLRERREDIAAIATALMARLAHEAGLPAAQLDASALEMLAALPLPGNVRELENLLTRAVAWSGGGLLDAAALNLGAPSFAGQVGAEAEVELASSSASAQLPDDALTSPTPGSASTPVAEPLGLPSDLQAHLDNVERGVLLAALARHRFNRTAAAAALGMNLRQMRYRLARLGIDVAAHKRNLHPRAVGEVPDVLDPPAPPHA